MEVTVKAFLQDADGNREVRRVSLLLQPGSAMFKTMAGKIASAFPGLIGKKFDITWEDSDGDFVLMSTDEELQDAVSQSSSGLLKVYITITDGQSVYGDGMMEEEEGPTNDQGTEVPQGRHDRAVSWTAVDHPDFPHPEGPPPPPPPPPFHPGMMMHGRRGRRGWMGGRGHHHGPYPGPFPGPHPMFHPVEWTEMPKMRVWPFGRFFGQGGMDQGPCAGQQEEGCDKRGWKRALRESVPVNHRRWAKVYIHNWRKQNLKNFTTTTSDSEQDVKGKTVTKEAAGVPEAYVVWLDMVLPKFHKRWETEVSAEHGAKDFEGDDADSMVTIKMSVPVEFRKWVWWYLARRYGKRMAPEFRCGSPGRRGHPWGRGHPGARGHPGPFWNGMGRRGPGKCGKKGMMGGKLHHLASQVPKHIRTWAKQFILTWRLEHQIPTTRPAHLTDSESDEVKGAKDKGIPEDYGKWLNKFLPRWHLWRGQVASSKVNIPAGGMGEFKDTVPMEFRCWTKCYLCRHYSQPSEGSEGGEDRYRRWLQIFKKKWLQQQKGGDEDFETLCITSSDEEHRAAALTSDPDTDMEMDSSFKRLRLDKETTLRNVRFAGAAAESEAAQGSDSDSDAEMFGGRMLGKHGFRRFAKTELYNWDGKTPVDGADDDLELPPRLYHVLSHMMVKMQKKKFKRDMKAAKKEMKAAAKAQKLSES